MKKDEVARKSFAKFYYGDIDSELMIIKLVDKTPKHIYEENKLASRG